MSALKPAEKTQDGRELWKRVVCRAAAAPSDDDGFREALLRIVVSDVGSSVARAADIAALTSEVEGDEDVDGWYGAGERAKELGWHDDASKLVLWLLSEKTTSGEA